MSELIASQRLEVTVIPLYVHMNITVANSLFKLSPYECTKAQWTQVAFAIGFYQLWSLLQAQGLFLNAF
jgi:hypothetical protein